MNVTSNVKKTMPSSPKRYVKFVHNLINTCNKSFPRKRAAFNTLILIQANQVHLKRQREHLTGNQKLMRWGLLTFIKEKMYPDLCHKRDLQPKMDLAT